MRDGALYSQPDTRAEIDAVLAKEGLTVVPGSPQLRDETRAWRPDAEPWEALREADNRAGGRLPFQESAERMAEALSEMGWTLAPDRVTGDESDDWRDGYNKGYEHGWAQCASEREAELEAENKRMETDLRIAERQWEVWRRRYEEARAELDRSNGESSETLRKAIEEIGRLRELDKTPVPEEPEGETGRIGRRLTAVEEAIWGRYHGKHRDVGLLNTVNYLARRVDALESPAPVPVEEPDPPSASALLGQSLNKERANLAAQIVTDVNAAPRPSPEECIDGGGHYWPLGAAEDAPATCTTCGYNPGWKAGEVEPTDDSSPAPEEPEKPECDRCGVEERLDRYDLDDVEVTLCGRCANEVATKSPLYPIEETEASPAPAPVDPVELRRMADELQRQCDEDEAKPLSDAARKKVEAYSAEVQAAAPEIKVGQRVREIAYGRVVHVKPSGAVEVQWDGPDGMDSVDIHGGPAVSGFESVRALLSTCELVSTPSEGSEGGES